MYKISRFSIYLILLLCLLLQAGVLNYITIMGARPDLLLAAVVFFGLFLGPAAGMETGIIAGLAKDVFALDFFWINAFILGMSGFLAGVINTKIFRESKRTEFIFVFIFTIFSMTAHYFIVLVLSSSMTLDFYDFLVRSVIPTAVYTALISIPVYRRLIKSYNLKEAEDYL